MDELTVSATSELPVSVRKRDGRLVPFEADKISQSLYAVSEELGQPNAFLARELTDAVLHFLAAEVETEQPTTAQIAEAVAKVVRELGQPAVASAFARRQARQEQGEEADATHEKATRSTGTFAFATSDFPHDVTRSCLRAYSLQAVFSRDLAAAHAEGLIVLGGLECPAEIRRIVIHPRIPPASWLNLLDAPARTIVFDSPEYALTEEAVRPWAECLARFCQATGRDAIINLHAATPPAWTRAAENGPLFQASDHPGADEASRVADRLFDALYGQEGSRIRVDWHLSERDFSSVDSTRLQEIAQKVGARHCFAFDRQKRSIALGPGLDREREGVLLDVGLNLPHFAGLIGHDAQAFLGKLPSLARMAVRAGIQKRSFLRRLGGGSPLLAQGFLLERARLVVVPLGLDRVVQTFLGQGSAGSKLSLDLGGQIIEVLHETLAKESRGTNLDIALDGPDGEFPGLAGRLDQAALHAAGMLHGIAGFGTLPLRDSTAPELVALLHHAWKKTAVVRLGGKA